MADDKPPKVGADAPEKIYIFKEELEARKVDLECFQHDCIKYILADLVEPSYGAEKIIRGDGKKQDEYVRSDIVEKQKADAYVEGYNKAKKDLGE